MQPHFSNLPRWLPSPSTLPTPFIIGHPIRPLDNQKILYSIQTPQGKKQLSISILQSYQISTQTITFNDMCQMTILNEPQVLNNVIKRYKNDQIFTYIGPTLIILNPYKYLQQYFDKKVMLKYRQTIINQQFEKITQPHVYMIAGKAYSNMKSSLSSTSKQAIVISGESGAGKTQSTKYCMQILTSLSHLQTSHSIQNKILSCNPLLQAFGNSKTIRNDNSSRFGKYVQIFFSNDNTIKGANINSYLLQKSRVVQISKGQRSFHVFYALTSSKKFDIKPARQYQFLKKSQCYQASNINDSQYFTQITKSMQQIGFSSSQQQKIWLLLKTILQLGNIKFDDKRHQNKQQDPCEIINKQLLKGIAQILELTIEKLQKLLLFERKVMVGNTIIFKTYKKDQCIGHRNTLCKAIYNMIFEFILYKIQITLNPKDMHTLKSINILDIFGFQNFQKQHNSLEQLCINFTNQKLLKLYNQYIFKRQMQILLQDGLQNDVKSIQPPNNQQIISLLSGNLSIFSLINDNTPQPQFTDQNIKDSIQNKLSKSTSLKFSKNKDLFLMIKHSQCDVTYSLNGFKMKNMDKINDDVQQIINNMKIINITGRNKIKQQKNSTLLKKFNKQIQSLITQLSSSNVHFIRCIKPNELKKPNQPDGRYILDQVRYLGVFQTIQIRKKTFPFRKDYSQFVHQYIQLFPSINNKLTPHSNKKKVTEQLLKQLHNIKQNQFMLGNKRVYINQRIQQLLNKMKYQFFKKRNQQIKKIQQVIKRYTFMAKVNRKLKQLVKRKKIWLKLGQKYKKQLLRQGINIMKNCYKNYKDQERIKKLEEQAKKNQQAAKKKKIQNQINNNKKVTEIIINNNKSQTRKNINRQQINQKFFKYPNKIIKAYTKLSIAAYFNKLKLIALFNSSSSLSPTQRKHLTSSHPNLNQTILVQSPQNFTPRESQNKSSSSTTEPSSANPSIFKLKKSIQQTKHQKSLQNKQHRFSQSFYNQQSVYISPGADVIFVGSLKINIFEKTSETIQKIKLLKAILNQQYKSQMNIEKDMCSPHSQDSFFKIEDCPSEIMGKIINFPMTEFFTHVLRKRTGVFGIRKDHSQILKFKPKPLNKTLTELPVEQQSQALKIFKLLIKIAQQTILDNVFKLVDNVMRYCQQTSQSLKNQIFLQLIKQSDNQSQVAAIRIYQTFSVFLHIYTPDQDFIYSGLNIFFHKIAQKKFNEKQQQYLRYLFKKMIRKIQRSYGVGYMPIKYQLMALMSKRQISIPIYLPIGNNVLIKVQSYQTFSDIKLKALNQLGINTTRIPVDFFAFFQVVNYQNTELQQSPINENSIIWDVMTYWQLAKQKYQQSGVTAPFFSIMIKIKYPFQCTYDDQQAIQIYFAQCYFDYSMGRIRLDVKQMAMLAACIKKIKAIRQEYNKKNNQQQQENNNNNMQKQINDDVQGCFPLWMTKLYDKQTFKKYIIDNLTWLQQNNNLGLMQLKYKFLQICSQSPLSMTFAIPTQNTIKLFLKPKRIYLVQKGNIMTQFSIRQIAKWSNTVESFNFQIRRKDGKGQNKTHIIMTEYSHMCTDYLNKVSQYLIKFGGKGKKDGNLILKDM